MWSAVRMVEKDELDVEWLQDQVRLGNVHVAKDEFDRLAQRHAREVLAACQRIVRDPERAAELAQDAWVTAA